MKCVFLYWMTQSVSLIIGIIFILHPMIKMAEGWHIDKWDSPSQSFIQLAPPPPCTIFLCTSSVIFNWIGEKHTFGLSASLLIFLSLSLSLTHTHTYKHTHTHTLFSLYHSFYQLSVCLYLCLYLYFDPRFLWLASTKKNLQF